MSVGTTQHHHRNTTKPSNKSFKSRHSTKSAIKEASKGKIEKGVRKTLHQQVMSKLGRRNQAKQKRLNNANDREEKLDVFKGKDGAPRIVAVVPLCEDVKSSEVVNLMLRSVDVDVDFAEGGAARFDISRFKQKVQYLTPQRDLLDCLDAARTADFVLFVLSANEEVDALGEQILKCVESQGVSTVLVGVHNLETVEPAKRRPDVLKSLKSFITHFFAAQEKVHDLSSRQDCSNAMRSLCTTTPKGIRWRQDRSWMLVDDVVLQDQTAVVTGFVRGRGLKADRLVQVGEWGDLQINKILAAPLDTRRKSHKAGGEVTMKDPDNEEILEQPTVEQDDLAELAPEDVMQDAMTIPATSIAPSDRKAVLLDDHHYFDEEEDREIAKPKRLPRGTSKYQAAWYLGDASDSGSDLETVDGDSDDMDLENGSDAAGPADGHFDDASMREPTEAGPSEYPQSEMFPDHAPEDEAGEIEAYRKQRRDDADEDAEFPDEIELHPHMNARERLVRYRGLKSLRTSHWETEEDRPYEPEAWRRLLEIANHKAAKNRATKDAIIGGVKPGIRVQVHLNVSAERLESIRSLPRPTAMFSLLKHEHKHTSCNHSISLSTEFGRPLKSKEQLVLQCGPRRLVIDPLFSQLGNTPNDVHKFERYLHPGRTAVASFIGPVTWGNVPCLYFKQTCPSQTQDAVENLAAAMKTPGEPTEPRLALVGTGTSLAPSTSRVIAKRIIVTGHPYKIHKRLVTVRYMFFDADDVNYFRALQLWTRRGRQGFIKEPLGTHGYFKATFDGKINPLDAVGVSLYKRMWPRQAKSWTRDLLHREEEVPRLITAEDAMEA